MRADLLILMQWIKPKMKVLDLACGNGELLSYLSAKEINGYGLEIDAQQIEHCLAKGINVIEQDIDQGLSNFANDTFDMVIMTQALQAMKRPDLTLKEMLRVAPQCIVTFPNFAYWQHRLFLTLRGKMPVSRTLPYAWYATPNIHLSTFSDFIELCQRHRYKIINQSIHPQKSWGVRYWPNLFGQNAIFHLSRFNDE